MGPDNTRDALLEVLLSNSEEAILCFRLDGTIHLWSSAAERLYGYAESEIIGQPASILFPLDELPSFLDVLDRPDLLEVPGAETAWRMTKSGQRVPIQLRRSVVRGQDGQILSILERASSLSSPSARFSVESHLRLLLEQLPVVFWTTDHRLRITSHWGPGFPRRRGAQSAVIGQSIQEYFRCAQPDQTPVKQHANALLGDSSRFEYQHRNRTFDVTLEPLRDGQNGIIGCLGLASDITERKKSEEEIRYLATHDGLTGLATYREFFESLQRELMRAERAQRPLALLVLDLDGLKRINDRLGHLAGNRALKRVARALKETCRASDLAARFGGDEFAVLLTDSEAAMAEQVATRVTNRLRQQPHPPPLSVSVGQAVYPRDARTAQELFEIADKRLYENRKSRRGEPVSQAMDSALSRLR